MAKEQIGGYRFSPQVAEASGRYRPAEVSEASRAARRGLACPWPAGGGEAVLSARLPLDPLPRTPPRQHPAPAGASLNSLLMVCPGAATKDCSQAGEPTRRSCKGQRGTRSEKRGSLSALP